MATGTMTRPIPTPNPAQNPAQNQAPAPNSAPTPAPSRTLRDSSAQEIINAARTAPATAVSALAVASCTSLLMWASFTPLDWGPLGWICLVPMLCLARIPRPTRAMYRSLYVAGLVFWLPTLQWMRLGDDMMYGAWIILSCYLASYFPVFIGLTRLAVHRLRVPLAVAVPVVWTGLELARAHLLTGFGWYNLSHSQYRWLEMIQISDITGAYGVSFVMALVSGCMAALLPESWVRTLRLAPHTSEIPAPTRPILQLTACLSVFILVLGYGFMRREQAQFRPGPRVALIQGNFIASARPDYHDVPRIFARYHTLTGAAIAQQPDLVVWPEGMFPYPLLSKAEGVSTETLMANHPQLAIDRLEKLKVPETLQQLSEKGGAAFIVGLQTIDVDAKSYRFYNSAVIAKSTGITDRYDKIHRVIFGEYIPLADWLPFLQSFTPYGGTFGIQAGTHASAFEFKSFRAVPVICYEDTVPHVVRNLMSSTRQVDASGKVKKADLLVNISNDGWFHGSSEHDQHLIVAAFRSVEMRTPMVRAVNTGVSAVIDGDGHIRARARNERTGSSKLDEAILVSDVPLDGRNSLYLSYGDWFGSLCLTGCFGCAACGVFDRFRRKTK